MTQSTDSRFTLHQGNSIEVLKAYPENHFDSVVCDPPYMIGFLGKDWDHADVDLKSVFAECLRVLKPGGHLLAFSAARTYHHLAMSVELAGFEIRDQIMWVYSSGFPKSQDVGKSIERSEKKRKDNALGIKRSKIASGPKTSCPKCNKTLNGSNQNTCEEAQCDLRDALSPANNVWAGWGTALKPAHEPIVVARKPAKMSIAKNVQIYGTGALNINASRIEVAEDEKAVFQSWWKYPQAGMGEYGKLDGTIERGAHTLDNQRKDISDYVPDGRFPSNVIGELGEYQKFFYCPKVSRKERHIGHEDPGPLFPGADGGGKQMLDQMVRMAKADGKKKKKHDHTKQARVCAVDAFDRKAEGPGGGTTIGNNHPTVKPQALMEYLIRLVTPPNSKVLDPFNGSGSTGMAAVKLGHHYTGIDLDANYIDISSKRITAWNQPEEESNQFTALFEETTK